MKAAEAVKIFMLGMITAFLAVLIFQGGHDESKPGAAVAADAAGAVAKGGDLLALTGEEKCTLFLIDPVNKQIAQYSVDTARFSLRAARYFKHDMFITEENRRGGIDVERAEKLAKESMSDR